MQNSNNIPFVCGAVFDYLLPSGLEGKLVFVMDDNGTKTEGILVHSPCYLSHWEIDTPALRDSEGYTIKAGTSFPVIDHKTYQGDLIVKEGIKSRIIPNKDVNSFKILEWSESESKLRRELIRLNDFLILHPDDGLGVWEKFQLEKELSKLKIKEENAIH